MESYLCDEREKGMHITFLSCFLSFVFLSPFRPSLLNACAWSMSRCESPFDYLNSAYRMVRSRRRFSRYTWAFSWRLLTIFIPSVTLSTPVSIRGRLMTRVKAHYIIDLRLDDILVSLQHLCVLEGKSVFWRPGKFQKDRTFLQSTRSLSRSLISFQVRISDFYFTYI